MKMASWFDPNKLTFNINNTPIILFSRKNTYIAPHNEDILRHEEVERVNEAKFLAVIVDQHHNWTDHGHNNISKKF